MLGGTYSSNVEMNVKNILPFAFSFGIGGPKMKQRVKVAFELCIQVYMRLFALSIYGRAYHPSYESYLQQANVIQKWGNDMQVKCRWRPTGRKIVYAIKRKF